MKGITYIVYMYGTSNQNILPEMCLHMHKYKKKWIVPSSLWYKNETPLQAFFMDHKINNKFSSYTSHKFKESTLV